jgi:hypothetical protein
MSNKENSNSQQNKHSSLGSDKSQKTKQSATRDPSNKNVNINTSIDEIKKDNPISKNVDFPDKGQTPINDKS